MEASAAQFRSSCWEERRLGAQRWRGTRRGFLPLTLAKLLLPGQRLPKWLPAKGDALCSANGRTLHFCHGACSAWVLFLAWGGKLGKAGFVQGLLGCMETPAPRTAVVGSDCWELLQGQYFIPV